MQLARVKESVDQDNDATISEARFNEDCEQLKISKLVKLVDFNACSNKRSVFLDIKMDFRSLLNSSRGLTRWVSASRGCYWKIQRLQQNLDTLERYIVRELKGSTNSMVPISQQE